MPSPITHEKIIEVLREALDDLCDAWEHNGGKFDGNITKSTAAGRTALEAARDLYQRLQAEKEGGDISSLFHIGQRVRKIKGSSWQGHIVGTYMTALTPEGYCVESEREPGSVQLYPASALEPIEPADDIDMATPELLRARPHVAPPASANARTGRATVLHEFDERTEYQFPELREILIEALSTEHQRGLAEGERIGVEKAAKVAEARAGEFSNAAFAATDPVVKAQCTSGYSVAFGISADIRSRALTGDPQT